jgi:hypothetical protein
MFGFVMANRSPTINKPHSRRRSMKYGVKRVVVVLSLVLCSSGFAEAADPGLAMTPEVRSAAGILTPDQLEAMLRGLGYQTERLDFGGDPAFKVKLGTKFDDLPNYVTIDPGTNLVMILGGGFRFPANPTIEGLKLFSKMH